MKDDGRSFQIQMQLRLANTYKLTERAERFVFGPTGTVPRTPRYHILPGSLNPSILFSRSRTLMRAGGDCHPMGPVHTSKQFQLEMVSVSFPNRRLYICRPENADRKQRGQKENRMALEERCTSSGRLDLVYTQAADVAVGAAPT